MSQTMKLDMNIYTTNVEGTANSLRHFSKKGDSRASCRKININRIVYDGYNLDCLYYWLMVLLTYTLPQLNFILNIIIF